MFNVIGQCLQPFDGQRELLITDMLHNAIDGMSSNIKTQMVKDGKEMTQEEWMAHIGKLRRTCGEFV